MTTSYNGWPASTDPSAIHVVPFEVAGVAFPRGVRAGDVHTVLHHVALQFHERVESLVSPGCWGYDFRPNKNDPSELSCHGSATAIDCNAPQHPNGIEATRNFTKAQIAEIHRILSEIPELDEVVHWGGDWHYADELIPDPMHFEIHGHDLAKLARVADRIRNQEDDMNKTELLEVLNSKEGRDAIGTAVRATMLPTAPQPDGSQADERLGSFIQRVGATIYALLDELAKAQGLTPEQVDQIRQAIATAAFDVDITVRDQTGD